MNKNHSLRSIQIVIWFLILATLIAFATSCSSTKRLVRSNYVESIDSTTVVGKTDSVAVKLTQFTYENTAKSAFKEDLEIQIIEYDTDKPVDSATGKPPLMREIKAFKNQARTEHSELNHTTVQRDSTAKSRSDTLAIFKFLKQTQSEDLKEKSRFIFPWWGIFGGLALALLLIFIFKKWRIFPRI